MKEILLLTIGFSPNIGGIETHFDDLTRILDKKGFVTWILTYKPLMTSVSADFHESRGKNINIYRLPVLKGLFYKFVKTPLLEFLFLTPGLFIALPILLSTKCRNVNSIHTHGLIAGFVGVFWGKMFGKKVITTTHSIYNFPNRGIYRNISKWIFGTSNSVLTLSKQSKKEIENLGIDPKKIKVFTYWIDLDKFKAKSSKLRVKKALGWENKFVVLFVGRLVEEKGVNVLLEAAKKWNKKITLAIVGTGPLEERISNLKPQISNLIFIGKVDNDDLPKYYNAADVLIVPSIHEEGFGRVILESLACGTPVIGSNRGAIPEAMDKKVGELIYVSTENIIDIVESLYENTDKLKKLSDNAIKHANRNFSDINAGTILQEYE